MTSQVEQLDLAWLDLVPEAVEEKLGPATRRVLTALRKLRKKEGGPK